jgi:hypothetical protein
MSKANKIAWIDDNPSRARTALELGAEFINVKDADLAGEVEHLLKGPQRRLVILDHILDKTTSTNPIFQRGSTIAEAIKEKWPACPVLGVTNADKVDKIDLRTKQAYDDVLPFSDFSKYFDHIEVVAKDFARVTNATLRKPADLVALLKPPGEDEERLEAALPDDLQRSLRDTSVGSRTYRWVNHLMRRPGFLYDDLWSATFLGVNDRGFTKIRDSFNRANYDGVFARDDDPRWWVSRLAQLLYKQVEPQPREMSWHVGRRLPGIRRKYYSQCYADCGDESPPEVVAYLDASSEDRRPMHLKCTVLHPRYKRELYFEDVRMMRGK